LLHSRNVLLAGTSVVAGQARAVVFATGMHTEFGKIAHLTQSTRAFLSPLQQEIQRLSRLVVVIAVALGAVFFLIGQVLGLSFWANVLFAIGIIVANVPEGLLPTVTLALAMGSQRMARKNALIRHLPSVETLGSATVICTDKTGTLTQNRLAVKRVFLSRQFHDVAKLTNPSLVSAHRAFFEVACHCHTLKEMAEQDRDILAGDPLEVALRRMAQEARPESSEYPRIDEVPFDSDRRRLSTLHRTPQGLMLYTKGALEALEPLCTHLFTGGKVQVLDAALRKELSNAQDALAAEGLRVLALAHRAVSANYNPDRLEEQLILVGLVGLADPPRPEVPDAVAKCRQAGIKVIMVTGDHPHTSRAIAKEIGLTGERPVVITGDKLRCLSATQLQLALDQPEILFARVSADQKMRIVQALKAKNHVVAVTGDGVNDAPALRAGDIGIAMGRTGTDVARAAADMVLLDDNFASIVAAIEEGRAVFANIRKFLTYILTSNVPELVPYLAFVLFKLPLALPIIQILAVDLGTDLLPALALGAETPEPGAMHRPPRPRTDRLLDWSLLLRSYGFLGVLEAMGALAAFFFVLVGAGWSYGQVLSPTDPVYLQATTACLSAIIVMQIANVFLCRSERSSSFSVSVFSNPLIWVGIAAELVLILLVDYTNLGNRLFGTAPIAWSVWLFVLPFAVGMFTLEEVRKLLLRFSVSSRD
jgi:calcium-translocating P-type ATPase